MSISVSKDSRVIRKIKEKVLSIFEKAKLLVPPGDRTQDPFELVREEMEQVVNHLESISVGLQRKVDDVTTQISILRKEKKEIEMALEEKEKEADIWIVENNLILQEKLEEQNLSILKQKYKEQENMYLCHKKAVIQLNREIGIEEQGILLLEGYVSKKEIEEIKKLEEKLKKQLELLREETKEKTEKILILAKRIGISNISAEKIEELLERTKTWLAEELSDPFLNPISLSEKEHKADISVDLKRAISEQNNGSASNVYNSSFMLSPAQARSILEKSLILEGLLTRRVEELKERMEVLGRRIGEEIAVFHSDSLISSLVYFSEEIKKMEEIYKSRINSVLQQSLIKVKEYSQKLEEITKISKTQETHAEIDSLPFDQQEELLSRVENQAKNIEEEYSILRNITEFISERKELLRQMAIFEERASDPQRLFRSSFQLVSEEKFRKMAVPTLLRVEKEILTLSEKHTQLFSRPVIIESRKIIEDLQNEISQRIINTNVFVGRNKR
ncbi:hypothetical protein NEFER03_0224 [Nematocida sp. LUAm3]|nr:hypothetical protein NEFER03_0224 [Nematocida sp. LUAm3]KAI5173677.1 hypothetical protein NEFER02_0193 [Nematocida sp. LUAm2]KAI5176898.1 hypothetical protein NEFER01_0223 [Nematocida sp. LUAm1]